MVRGKHKIHCPIERQNRRVGMLEMRNQGFTYALIASKFNCSISNAKSTIDRFRKKLERLNKNGNQN